MDYIHRVKVDVIEVRVSDRARRALTEAGETIGVYLTRHVHGDWGEADDETTAGNELALREEGHLISLFTTATGGRICLVTEVDVKRTTALLAEEVEEVLSED